MVINEFRDRFVSQIVINWIGGIVARSPVLGDPKTPLNIFDGCLIDFFLIIKRVLVPAIIQCFGWQYCTGIIGEFLGWRE